MQVTLVDYTEQAARLLVLAKSTRLDMAAELLQDVGYMDEAEVMEQLEYIANTVPSSWEFVHYTFLIQDVSRAFTHQFVRTRTGSYAQQTLRLYNNVTTNGGDELVEKFIWPAKVTCNKNAKQLVKSALINIGDTHEELLGMGIPPEDARSILPTNFSTNILASFNLRSFAQLVQSRSGGRTQSEYRDVVQGMVEAVLKVHPWVQQFIFKRDRDYFAEIEAFAEKEYGNDLKKKGELLKIVDKMRAEK